MSRSGAKRAEVSLGDLVTALHALAPDDDAARRAIATKLGFAFADSSDNAETHTTDAQLSVNIAAPEPSLAQPQLRERQYKLLQLPSRKRRIQAVPVPTTSELPVGVSEDQVPRPPLEPLLQPRWSRAVIATLAKRKGPRGQPDVPKLIAFTAQSRVPMRLPLLHGQIASGADVLVDVGPNMLLFARDQQLLVNEVRRVLGRGQVPVFRFTGSPMRGVMPERGRSQIQYRPRSPRWPILLLTDLGIASEPLDCPTSDEWAALAGLARAQGSRLVALVPYPPRRWPAGARSALTLVPWDRDTAARSVRAALRRRAR